MAYAGLGLCDPDLKRHHFQAWFKHLWLISQIFVAFHTFGQENVENHSKRQYPA